MNPEFICIECNNIVINPKRLGYHLTQKHGVLPKSQAEPGYHNAMKHIYYRVREEDGTIIDLNTAIVKYSRNGEPGNDRKGG